MNRFRLLPWFLAAGLAFPVSAVHACGALMADSAHGMGLESLRNTQRPSSILIYRSPGSVTGVVALNDDFVETLKDLGHTVQVAASAEEAKTLLQSKPFDLLLAPLAELRDLLRITDKNASPTVGLPVVDKSDKPSVDEAEKTYGVFLWTPSRKSSRAMVVEHTVRTRLPALMAQGSAPQ